MTETLLRARVTPRGGRDAVEGFVADEDGRRLLKLRVAAAPTDGAANKAVVKLVAKFLGLPKSAVTIRSGETARVKTLAIDGDADAIERALSALPSL